eukprot:TRINITY_DN5301_c0_g1_i1.p2 TRINITY_DN5301_c0_g1~~TRINITY_DN5301_c0_g1_i1.p2  ORF type:complete len:117 (+),score=16.56 TRINITY_DN5301_c0_g1_i1:273-623(+)
MIYCLKTQDQNPALTLLHIHPATDPTTQVKRILGLTANLEWIDLQVVEMETLINERDHHHREEEDGTDNHREDVVVVEVEVVEVAKGEDEEEVVTQTEKVEGGKNSKNDLAACSFF